MSEVKKTEQFLQEKKETEMKKMGERRNLIIMVSIAAFLTFCCCSLFFFFLYRNQEFTAYSDRILTILQPIVIGIVLAYLLNPIMVFVEGKSAKILKKYVKNEKPVAHIFCKLAETHASLE